MKITTLKYSCLCFLLILISACNKNDTEDRTITGKIITLQYDHLELKHLDESMYIEIDGTKYEHKKNLINTGSANILPSYNIILMDVEGKKLSQNATIISITSALVNQLSQRNEYNFINSQAMSMVGKTVFKRRDKQPITIRIPKNYPVHYSTSER